MSDLLTPDEEKALLEKVLWPSHEPLQYMRRRGGIGLDYAQYYEDYQKPENIRRWTKLLGKGGMPKRLHFFKGMGLETEREEIERTDVAKAQYFVATRQILPNGDVRAAAELQRVVIQNKDSKHSNQHILDLAELYEELAFEYPDAHPPESLEFDPARFQELVEATTRLYELVAGQDGKPERLEASRRLEAFLAFVLRVDRDRFTR